MYVIGHGWTSLVTGPNWYLSDDLPDGDPIKEPPRTDPVPPEDEPADEPEGDD